MDELKREVAELKRQLQEAERAAVASDVAQRLHGIEGELPATPLGPLPTAEVEIEGVPARALLDTGSPVTIVDLTFVVEALAKKRDATQTPADWIAAVETRFTPPVVLLKSYGGQELPLVGQIKVTLARSNYTVEATIQVQKDAPVTLLVGTDLQSQLGFMFLAQDGGQTSYLLQRAPSTDADVVRLLDAIRLPPQHMRMVRAQAVNGEGTTLFQPLKEMAKRHGLQVGDAVVEPDPDGKVTLIIENRGHHSVDLPESCVLGSIYPIERVYPDDIQQPNRKTIRYAITDWEVPGEDDIGRLQQIVEAVGLKDSKLSPPEQQKLIDVIHQYQDLFALDSSELGTTDLVTHSIHTGDHQPIRQPICP